jgi:hypothetical protein
MSSTISPPLESTLLAQAAALTPYYGLVYLSLAAAAYTDSAGKCKDFVTNDITNLIQNPQTLPPLPAAGQTLPIEPSQVQQLEGSWKITWVPQYSPNNYANLLYAAAFFDSQNQPILMAVSIRGTDITSGGLGLLQQLREDVTAGVLNDWTKISGIQPQNLPGCTIADPLVANPKIATGSCVGFYDLIKLTAPYLLNLDSPALNDNPPLNIADFVGQFAEAWPSCPIVVTGHSLGACQATVMALYLKSLYPKAIIAPNPFAPPTAGNVDFYDAWGNVFSPTSSNIWINPGDLVPNAFASMTNIWGLWNSSSYPWPSGSQKDGYGPPVPVGLDIALGLIIAAGTLTDDDHYQQLPVDASILLTSEMPDLTSILLPFMARNGLAPGDLWLGMLMWQHFPPCYFNLMSTQLASDLIYFPLVPSLQCAPTPAPNPDPNSN